MNQLCKAAALFAAVLILPGCATVMNGGGSSEVQLVSEPAGASYEIRDVRGRVVGEGVTPSRHSLKGGYGYGSRARYQVLLRKEGYADQKAEIVPRRNPWYWFNIVFGGPIGLLIVDPATGAMYKMPPQLAATLTPLERPAVTAAAPSTSPPNESKEQRLAELLNKNLSYEEYAREYRSITAE